MQIKIADKSNFLEYIGPQFEKLNSGNWPFPVSANSKLRFLI